MTQKIWTQEYDVNTVVLNPQKRLGLYGLLNLLQDAAWVHAEHLGCGFKEMMSRGTIWVLTRQILHMSAWPAWGERIAIRTWSRPISGAMAYRDYEILCGERTLGEATSSWLTLDWTNRRPQRLNLIGHPIACREEGYFSLMPSKIPLLKNLDAAAMFHVRNSDLDMNGHVNNTRYAQWILDSIPPKTLAAWEVAEYEVNFLAETNVGDTVAIECDEQPAEPGISARRQFQGRRASDGKIAFAARFGVRQAE